ncbi:MAG: hypothetical protein LAP13_11375 [Acidobacteriia bacterium]|nr:hypothetical protein [Terriglobia bacterium]
MKKAIYVGMASLVVACLSLPAWAQKSGHGGSGASHAATGVSHSKKSSHKSSMATDRSNKGGAMRGKTRAEEVQQENAKADTERGFTEAPGMTQTTGKAADQTKGKSTARSHTGTKPTDAGTPHS